MHRIRRSIRPEHSALFIRRLVTSSDSSATFIHEHCSVGSSRSFANTQKFRPKARHFLRLFPASVGRINGHSGGMVILASWSPTPLLFVIRIILQPTTR